MASKEQLSLEYTMFCYAHQNSDADDLASELSKLIIAEALEPFSSETLSSLVNALATICEEFMVTGHKVVADPVTYFNKQYCKVMGWTYDKNKEDCTSNWDDDWPEDANWRKPELNAIARLEAGKWIHKTTYFRNMALAKET